MRLLVCALAATLVCAVPTLEELFALVEQNNAEALKPHLAPDNVNLINPATHMSLLMTAATLNHVDTIKALILKNADPLLPTSDAHKLRPIDGAAFKGHAEVVRILIALELPCNAPGIDGLRPLHRAAWGPTPGHTQTVEHLLSKCPGVKVDVETGSGATALHFAVRAKEANPSMITLLVNAGASTAKLSAAELDRIKLAMESRKAVSKDVLNAMLLKAVSTDSFTGVTDALSAGANVNHKDPSNGQTALMTATLRGNARLVDELLAKWNADPSVGEQKGYTPMHGAGFQGRAEVARVLIKHGVPVSDKHEDGFFPIHRAAWGTEQRHADFIRVVVSEGKEDVDKLNGKGQTPLQMLLLGEGDKSVVANTLVELGANTKKLTAKQLAKLGVRAKSEL